MSKKRSRKSRRPRIRTNKKVVFTAITAIILFWFEETRLLESGGAGYPDVFIISWFTFWSVELAALAGIKITEVRKTPYTSTGMLGDNEIYE